MRLKELCELLSTYHFKIRLIESEARELYFMADYLTHKYDDYEVIGIDATTEIGTPSPITYEVAFRPILLITIKYKG